MGIDALLDMTSGAVPDRIACGSRAAGRSFAELARRAAGGAALLAATGARHVGYPGVQGEAFPAAVYAAAAAGLPMTPLNYRLTDADLAELIGRLDTPVVLADRDQRHRVPAGVPVLTTGEWFVRAAETEPAGPPADPSEVAVMLFTSGTTARPKAVVLRHEHLMAYVLGSAEFLSAGDDDCALVAVPPYHVAGIASVLSNVYAGRRVAYLSDFTPQGWLETVRRERVTHALVVPTMLARVVRHLDGAPACVPELRSLAYGGAKVSASVLEAALAAFPATDFVNAYGLTETSSTIAVLGPADHRAALASDDPVARQRLSSAGRPLPGVELSIRGEDGCEAGPGESGGLWVRGPQISGEYAGLGSALDKDGWFPTRDVAWIDSGGCLFIEGRGDDTIVRGGENVAPAEIEAVLDRHPGIAEVAVVGVPDEEWGQRTVAVVVSSDAGIPDAEALRAWSRERLRSSRTPDEFVFRGSLPYTPTGKLLRRELVAELAARATSS
ncbi:class I adenylate-forming enzyme family protein [Uniformispora flossi]|uniref:class I adenylate-forming enzyme family protein n=1 Tax=Uniformispora flossi TaxID=3390723 RepID=UPI003C2DE953